MGKTNDLKKTGRRKQGKENVPDLLSNSLLENILGDNINDIVGRRSDVGKRSLHIVDSDTSISSEFNNDDEKEKEELRIAEQERVERERAAAARSRPTGLSIISALSQEELDQHYSKCIEMCNRNKVNVKNAFKLQLIDYMKLIVSNQSTKSENLTLMSCTLGASAKIYGLRVDKVYTDMLKILSGKSGDIEKEESDEENAGNEDGDGEDDVTVPKKKQKSTDSSDEEEDAKGINFEAMLLTEVQLSKGKGGDEEPQEKATIPRGLEYFLECQQLDPDGRFCLNPPVFSNLEFDKSYTPSTLAIDDMSLNGPVEKLDPCNYILDYKNIRRCFSIMDEEEGTEDSAVAINSSLVFDPSSNIADSIRIDTEERDLDFSDMAPETWGPDYDEDDDALPEPAMCSSKKSGQISSIQPKTFTAQTMSNLVSVKAGDYSFFDNSRIDFWAGPRHWSLRRAKAGEKAQKPGGENIKKTGRKSCDLNFSHSSVKERRKFYIETMSALLARKTILTWSTRRCKIPQDSTYSQKHLISSMKNELLIYVKKDSSTNMICNISLQNDAEETVLNPDDFGINMDHVGDDDDDDDNHFDGEMLEPMRGGSSTSMVQLDLDEPAHETDDCCELVPAPQRVNKIAIKYAKAQKRIDIKELKRVMWETMDLENRDGNDGLVDFRKVYEALPQKMPSEEAAELSFPIAFMALLHTANEKNLTLTGNDDHSNVFVTLDK